MNRPRENQVLVVIHSPEAPRLLEEHKTQETPTAGTVPITRPADTARTTRTVDTEWHRRP